MIKNDYINQTYQMNTLLFIIVLVRLFVFVNFIYLFGTQKSMI